MADEKKKTPKEKLFNSNDDYHEAFGELMEVEEGDTDYLTPTQKAKIGCLIRGIFNEMDNVKVRLNEMIPEEE